MSQKPAFKSAARPAKRVAARPAKSVYVFGDSHVSCLLQRPKRFMMIKGSDRTSQDQNVFFWSRMVAPARIDSTFVLTDNSGRRILDPRVETDFFASGAFDRRAKREGKVANAHVAGAKVVLCFGGNMSYRLRFSGEWARIDFVEPQTQTLRSEAEYVPYELVVDHFRLEAQYLLEGFKIIHDRYPGDYFMLSGPPPHRDAEIMIRTLRERGGSALPVILPAELRLKLWRVQQSVLQGVAKSAGMKFIQPHPNVSDEDGFLRPNYYGDGFHANASYGTLMRKCILKATHGVKTTGSR